MKIQNLSLTNFRNYAKAEVTINSDLVLILGPNASGKTNFLESIYYLSNLKSFRAPDNSLVNFDQDFLNVEAGTNKPESLEVVVQKTPAVRKAFKINGQKVKKIAWNAFQTVLFDPTDLNLFSSGPSERRRFLNEVLSAKDSVYALDLSSLDHILKQRAALLYRIQEGSAKEFELEFWDDQLAEVSLRIGAARRGLIDFLNDRFNAVFRKLSHFEDKYLVVYKGLEEGATKDSIRKRILDHRQAEIATGTNLIGPHREDFSVLKEGISNIHSSSRGELREQVIAIKLLQANYLSVGEDRPIMLMDDVFSELDGERQRLLLENLGDYQVFITSTDPALKDQVAGKGQVLEVENGKLNL
ncbi:MAG: DNA replication/repair protein RecF [Acidobacteriaceae bacterium]